jgi:competence protein ComEC
LGLTSLLAGAASMPFIAYHFGSVQVYFVLANLVAVPLTALWVMPAGLLALALMPLGLERLALAPMGWGIAALLRLAHAVAGWPGATLAAPHVPMGALLTMAFGLAWLCLWRGWTRALAVAPLLAGGVTAWLSVPPDVLAAADARLAAVRGTGALYVQAQRGGDAYVQAAWQQLVGLKVRDLAQAPGAVCDADGCSVQLRGSEVRVGAAGACGATVWVVLAGGAPACAGALAIDRAGLARNGAAAAWLSARPRLVTDRAVRGARPWVFLRPEQDRASLLDLPMAPTE